ncbi:hypothetical protein GCM10010466_31590 [Planomonospora alba]|uniref:DUF2631 domain-containing protein n=1 Tax=Planomonospora alba TaxID=161354 RepID=A0ABP6N6U7_9ACTN
MSEPSTASFEHIRESRGTESAIQALGAIAPSRKPRNNVYAVRGVSSALIFLAGVVEFLSALNGNESFAPMAIVLAIIGIGGRIEAAVRLRP